MKASLQFAGGQRFALESRLGSGGRGVVYRARDRTSGRQVALKTLRTVGPDEILRLKREFRQLRSVRHPNVIRLFELAEDGGHWFYTMELVRGVPLTWYVRPEGELDVGRLRDVLAQVVPALAALHRAGVVHRDVKPSNIMVEHEGRAVLLDPGVGLRGRGSSVDDGFGTAEYMAPEQAEGSEVTAAADWYALGCTVYEALVGEPPRGGTRLQILGAKIAGDLAVPAVEPADLRQLTAELLRRNPDHRPGADAILAALGAEPESLEAPATHTLEVELETLTAAWARARAGHPATVLVHGASGAGKTALLDAFAARGPAPGQLFRGRCDPRESVRFRALDSLVDAMTDYLCELEPDDGATLLPERIDLLARAFPVLRRADAVLRATAGSSSREPMAADSMADALGALVAAIGEREGGIAIVIDDLELADDDSTGLLARLAAQPRGAHTLLVGASRMSTVASPWLENVALAASGALASIEHIVLENSASDETAETPARARTVEPLPGDLLAAVGEDARDLAHLLAAAGQPPLSVATICRALGWDLARFESAVVDLEDAAVARPSDGRHSSDVVLESDALARRIELALAPEQRRLLHLRLATAIAATDDDPERAGRHFAAAGDEPRASRCYTRAAEDAVARLSFGRARRLYQRALERLGDDAARRQEVLTRRGDCNQANGLLAAAAEDYLTAATSAEPATAIELRRMAADCLIRTGELSRGLAVQRDVFRALGIDVPATPRAAHRSLLWRRLRVRTRGLGFTSRAAEDVPLEAALRTDALLAAGLELSVVDFVRGGDLQTRGLLAALDCGDPERIARALVAEAAYAGGQGNHARADALIARSSRVAGDLPHPYLDGYRRVMQGALAVIRGQWSVGLERCDEGIAHLRQHAAGADWEIHTTEHFARWALWYRGELVELERRVQHQLLAADARGDHFAGALLRTGFGSPSWLARDQPEVALEQCDRARSSWPSTPFLTPHWYEVMARANALLYRGEAAAADALLTEAWPRIERSLVLRVECIRIEALFLRARIGLATGTPAGLADAERWRRRLARERLAWPRALAAMLAASAARVAGEARASELAGDAETALEAQGAVLFARLVRLGRAELDGDDDTRAAVRAWAETAGIARIDGLAAAFAPGLVASRAPSRSRPRSGLDVRTLTLPTHVNRTWVEAAVAELGASLSAGTPVGLVLDASGADGFDAEARARLTGWLKRHRQEIARIGVITDSPALRVLARAGAIIIDTPLRTFTRGDDCRAWVARGE